jgi:hypothetical protein
MTVISETLAELLTKVSQSDLEITKAQMQSEADKRKALRLAENSHALSITELMQKLSGSDQTETTDLQIPSTRTEEAPNVRPVAGTFPAPPTGPAAKAGV